MPGPQLDKRSTVITRDDAGNETTVVSFARDDGALLEARTRVAEGEVRSEVSVTKEGQKETWGFVDNFIDDTKDRAFRRLETASGAQSEASLGVNEFLQKRGELFADKSEGVDFDPLRLTYSTKYTSAVLLSSGSSPAGEPVHVLASLGVHAAFPFPGEHWDEGQLAILDADFKPKLTLRMPQASEKTHLELRFEDVQGPSGEPLQHVRYQGHMEGDDGKLHFVQALYVLSEEEATKSPGLWDRITGLINRSAGFDQNAKVLKELPVPASTLSIDGKEVLRIERSLGAIDDGARFNRLAESELLAINYAPPDSPLLALVDPEEKQTRYRFDATLLRDEKSLLHRLLPRVLRQGLLAAHYVVDADGRRRDVSETMRPDGEPLSTKHYTWQLRGKPVATLTRELVRYRDPKGRIELGFREVIRRLTTDSAQP